MVAPAGDDGGVGLLRSIVTWQLMDEVLVIRCCGFHVDLTCDLVAVRSVETHLCSLEQLPVRGVLLWVCIYVNDKIS